MRQLHPEYPRPQFVRERFQIWNGEWEFAFDDENIGCQEAWWLDGPFSLTIQVPFSCETKRSGIGDPRVHTVVWYRRAMEFDHTETDRVWLWFEGCDYHTSVWVNGQLAGEHTGGSVRFGFDVTDALTEGPAVVVVRAEDPFTPEIPRGKQRWLPESFGCWYVQTTGIWKTVWSETVSPHALQDVRLTPDPDSRTVTVDSRIRGFEPGLELETAISFRGTPVSRTRCALTAPQLHSVHRLQQDDLEWGVAEWSPEAPHLYDIEFRLYQDGVCVDTVSSYFGLRRISIQNGQVRLNGRPLYQRLILDQGYWPDSGITPPDAQALCRDVELIRSMGFNGARKHQKIEDERFLYWCDVKGLLIWSEMPSAYRFTDDAAAAFTQEWMEAVRQNYNHPCVITWVPFNESWGIPHIAARQEEQNFTKGVYFLTKAYDPMRPVICNDGWEHTISDLITLHDYERNGSGLRERYGHDLPAMLENRVSHASGRYAFADGCAYAGQPVLLSEYGGVALPIDGEGWGYNDTAASAEELRSRLADLTSAIRALPGFCGYCVTQLTDVQQEINGLLAEDRTPKVPLEQLREIFGR